MAGSQIAIAVHEPRQLSADTALRIGWVIWCVLLTVPFLMFLAVVWQLMDNESVEPMHASQHWFIWGMCYMGIVVPLAFFVRSRIFRGYWSGCCVSPAAYLAGMITVWVALEIGGLLALAGCLMAGQLLPDLMPALLAFMLFTPLWPSGHAMTHPLQNERDPAHYKEPR